MDRQTTTSEKQFRRKTRDRLVLMRRDIAVFVYLFRIFWLWLTVGGRLRRKLRHAERTGEKIILDRVMGSV